MKITLENIKYLLKWSSGIEIIDLSDEGEEIHQTFDDVSQIPEGLNSREVERISNGFEKRGNLAIHLVPKLVMRFVVQMITLSTFGCDKLLKSNLFPSFTKAIDFFRAMVNKVNVVSLRVYYDEDSDGFYEKEVMTYENKMLEKERKKNDA